MIDRKLLEIAELAMFHAKENPMELGPDNRLIYPAPARIWIPLFFVLLDFFSVFPSEFREPEDKIEQSHVISVH